MTEKRFTSDYNGDETLLTHFLEDGNPLTKQGVLKLLNDLHKENEQLKQLINDKTCDNTRMKKVLNNTKRENYDLKEENRQLNQQLNDITLEWTQNCIEFDKDELYVKDNNTEIKLKNRHLHISVFIPQIGEHLQFHYIVTGRRLEREYNTLKGD